VPSIRARFFPASPSAIGTSPPRANISARVRVPLRNGIRFLLSEQKFRWRRDVCSRVTANEIPTTAGIVRCGRRSVAREDSRVGRLGDSKTGARFFFGAGLGRERRHFVFSSPSVGTSRPRVDLSRCPARSTS
jgi:hypothetical protein